MTIPTNQKHNLKQAKIQAKKTFNHYIRNLMYDVGRIPDDDTTAELDVIIDNIIDPLYDMIQTLDKRISNLALDVEFGGHHDK